MSVMSVVGVLAGVAVIVELAPQPLRIWRTRSLAGISVAGSGIVLVNEAGWFIYGATGGYGAIMATSLVAGSLKVWQFALTRPRWSTRSLGLVAAWVVAIVFGVATETLGVVLVGGLLAGLGPQALAVVRSPCIAGVSPWRWWLALASGVLWLAYGLMSGAWPSALTGLAGVLLSVCALRRIVVASRVLGGRVGGAVQTSASAGVPVPG